MIFGKRVDVASCLACRCNFTMKLLHFAVFAAAFARADYLATLGFSGKAYGPTSCSVAPAIYQMDPVCINYSERSSSNITCINRTAYTPSYFSSSDCSGVPTMVGPPQPVDPNWCKPYSGPPPYTAFTSVCMSGDFMASSPDTGLISINVNTFDQLCPNPNGPVSNAILFVQVCETNRTCSQRNSLITTINECVTAGKPVPPPFVPPAALSRASASAL